MKTSDSLASCFWREINQYLMTSTSRKQHQQVYPSSLGLSQPKRDRLGLSESLGISQPQPPSSASTVLVACQLGWRLHLSNMRSHPGSYSSFWYTFYFRRLSLFSLHYPKDRFVNLYLKFLLQKKIPFGFSVCLLEGVQLFCLQVYSVWI